MKDIPRKVMELHSTAGSKIICSNFTAGCRLQSALCIIDHVDLICPDPRYIYYI